MNLLITGATGFVGEHLISKIEGYNFKIIVREISIKYTKDIQIVWDKDSISEFRKEIKNFNPDIVIHLASYLTSADDVSSIGKVIDSNIFFTSILLESLKETNLKLFINTGSFAEFFSNDGIQNPAYFYSASKLAIRPIIKYFKNIIGFKNINIVPYTIYGGKSKSKKVIDYIIDSLESEKSIDMTNGEQILDFIHIDDVVDFYITCLNNTKLLNDEEDYHLGTGLGTSIKKLSIIIEYLSNKKTNINWGAREYRPFDIMKSIAPINKIQSELNWKPKTSIEDGIKKILSKEN